MKTLRLKSVLLILAAMAWISISEFVRNQFLLASYWTDHYRQLGLNFPASSVNGAIWGLWSLCFAVFIYFIRQRFNIIQCTLLAWFVAFPMMWLVLGNLLVLPLSVLPMAIPLSLLEVFGSAWILGNTVSAHK